MGSASDGLGGDTTGENTGTHPGDEAHALATQLDVDFAAVTSSLTRTEREAIARWQKPDRGYEAVQRYLRTQTGDPQVRAWARRIGQVIGRGQLARDVTVWRGIRSAQATFGVPADYLRRTAGVSGVFYGFTATTLARDVATREFTEPELAGAAVLLRMHLPAGLESAWLRPISMRRQMELLLPDRLKYRIVTSIFEGDLLTADLEVLL